MKTQRCRAHNPTRIQGAELVGKKYTPLFDNTVVKLTTFGMLIMRGRRGYRHCAPSPAFGEEDYDLAKKKKASRWVNNQMTAASYTEGPWQEAGLGMLTKKSPRPCG